MHSCAIELSIFECFSCDVIAIEMCNGLSLLSIRAGLLMITICCDPTTIVTEELFSQLPMYLLLKHPCNNKMKRLLSTWLLHKLNFEFSRQLINCTLMKPLTWLSVKWVLVSPVMFESNQTWYMKKDLLQYIVCADKGIKCFVAWSSNNQDLCLCLWFPSLAFYLTCWIMNPTSVWVLTVVDAQVQVSSHYCSCNIILLLGWCDFITIKAQCLLTSFRQTTQVKFYCC